MTYSPGKNQMRLYAKSGTAMRGKGALVSPALVKFLKDKARSPEELGLSSSEAGTAKHAKAEMSAMRQDLQESEGDPAVKKEISALSRLLRASRKLKVAKGATSESTLPGKSKEEEYARASAQRDADDVLAAQQAERSLKAGERKEREKEQIAYSTKEATEERREKGKGIQTGVKGGKFYLNSAGNKVYVK